MRADPKSRSGGDVVDLSGAPYQREQPPAAGGGGGSGNGGDTSQADHNARKLAAKRINESTKLVATTLNSLGLAFATVAIVQPLIADPFRFVIEYRPVWYFVALGLHIVSQFILRTEIRSEE